MAKTFKKHTPSERAFLYQIYQNEFALGKKTEEIARQLGLSESTLYRWQRLKLDNHKDVLGPPAKTISDVIAALSCPEADLSYELLHNICFLNAWLRWPKQSQSRYHAITAGMFQYLYQKFGNASIADLSVSLRQGIMQHILLEKFAQMCTPNFAGQSDFALHRLSGQNYTEIDVAANLAWYLLASKKKPDFTTAYTILLEGIDGYKWDFSLSTFREFWRNNLPASPFLYVQNYHSTLTWTLDPFASDYVDLVDELVRQPRVRREFFSNAQVAVETVKVRVDPRSVDDAFRELKFPSNLPPPTMIVGLLPLKSAKQPQQKGR